MQYPEEVAVPIFQAEDMGSDPFGPKRWNLVIRCFFDDSGKEGDPDNRIVCIAGYLAAGETRWNVFGEEWGHQLLAHGLTWLHMTDLMADQGEYAFLKDNWPKKKALLDQFIGAIKISGLIGFGVAVDADAWRKVPKEITRVEGDAQQFCFLRIMRLIVERMKLARPNDYVAVHFDCDKAFSPSRFQRFIGVRDRDPEARRYLQTFTIAEPKLYFPLQAADLLAWESRKELMRRLGGFESRPEFNEMFEVMSGYFPDYTGEFWDEETIEKEILKKIREQQTGQANDGTIGISEVRYGSAEDTQHLSQGIGEAGESMEAEADSEKAG